MQSSHRELQCKFHTNHTPERLGLYIMVFLAMIGAMNAATRSEVQGIIDKTPMCVMGVQQ